MSVNIQTYFVQQYARNIVLLAQQMRSRLRMAVTEGRYVGKAGSPVEQIGKVAMQPVISRFAPMGRVDPPTDRRWVYPNDFDLPQLMDSFDDLRVLVDPKSKQVEIAVAAAQRQYDDLIISGLLGTAKTGETGQNSITIPTTQIVSVAQGAGSATGFTLAKLRKAIAILRGNEAIPDNNAATDVYCALNAAGLDGLLAEYQVTSTDFNGGAPVLRDGYIDRFLGVQFIHTERPPVGTDDLAGTSTKVPLWQKEGAHLGIWGDISTNISQRHDLQGEPWQAYVKMTAGATRLEEVRVVQIWQR